MAKALGRYALAVYTVAASLHPHDRGQVPGVGPTHPAVAMPSQPLPAPPAV